MKGNLVTEARQDLLARDFRSNVFGFGETAKNKLEDESASVHPFIHSSEQSSSRIFLKLSKLQALC